MVPVVGLGKEAVLRAALARALDVEEGAILGYDLALYDTEKAALGGLGGEFVFSARLDNLASCHAAVTALAAAARDAEPATRLIALYDHEECGSRSAVGAAGSVLRDTVARIVEARSGRAAAGARPGDGPLAPGVRRHGARRPPQLRRPARAAATRRS